jgi:hypothetical protein
LVEAGVSFEVGFAHGGDFA